MHNHVAEAARFLKALANDQRLLILCCLLEGPRSVTELNERISLSQSALSQHLGLLRTAGLLSTRRASQTIYYTMTQGPTLKVMDILYKSFCSTTQNELASSKARRRTHHPSGRYNP